MSRIHRPTGKKGERGVALLIAIFVLMLISVVAAGMILSARTETSLASNYRGSSSAYYAALAGLEEARGRLLPTNPNYFNSNNFIPTSLQTGLAVGQVRYILNPVTGETVSPANLSSTYADNEYANEYGAAPPTSSPNLQTVTSVTPLNGGATPGPWYKWVRITPATEKSLGIGADNTKPLFYDLNATPYMTKTLTTVSGTTATNASPTAYPVWEIAALAAVPGGSEKLVETVVTANTFGLSFKAALSMPGTVGAFAGANSNPYYMYGIDGQGGAPAVPGCVPNAATVPAIGVSAGNDLAGNATNQNDVVSGLPRPTHYVGSSPNPPIAGNNPPSVSNITLPANISSPAQLNQLVQNLKQNANGIMPPPGTNVPANNDATTYNFGDTTNGWPTGMSQNNPQVVFVDGSFDLGPNTGYGILVVTGNFIYHGNSGWNGIILVVGDGTTTFDGMGGGNGQFNGAIFVATTRDVNGNQLSNFGNVNFDISGGGGNGIYYNSCWINKVQTPPSYKVLSFKEIAYHD